MDLVNVNFLTHFEKRNALPFASTLKNIYISNRYPSFSWARVQLLLSGHGADARSYDEFLIYRSGVRLYYFFPLFGASFLACVCEVQLGFCKI